MENSLLRQVTQIYTNNCETLENIDIFHRVPEVFNYTKSIKERGFVKKFRMKTQDPSDADDDNPDHLYPMKVSEYHSGYFSMMRLLSASKSLKNLVLDANHHESYVYEGIKYVLHSPYDLFSKSSVQYQSVTDKSLIIYISPQKIIIDKALESYKPKRSTKCQYNSGAMFTFDAILDVDVTLKERSH